MGDFAGSDSGAQLVSTFEAFVELTSLGAAIAALCAGRDLTRPQSEAFVVYDRAIAKLRTKVRAIAVLMPTSPCTSEGEFEVRRLCLEWVKTVEKGSIDERKREFADYYGKLLESKRYTSHGINDAKTPEQFAHALKSGSYYEDSESNYSRGLRAWDRSYSGGSGNIMVGSIPITITNPGATHEQIQRAVTNGVRDGIGQQTQRNMANLGGVYQ